MITQIENNIKAEGFTAELKKYLAKELKILEQDTLNDIARDVPRGKTGELARSIKSKRKKLRLVIGSDLFYAPYQEFGTIKGYDTGGSAYASSQELGSYPAQFKGSGIKKNGGISPKKFFFRNVRDNFFKMINRIK